MPNWCENQWRIWTDTPEEMEQVKDALLDENGKLTFEKLVPRPEIIKNTGSGGRDFDGVMHESWYVKGDEVRPFTPEEKNELAMIGYLDWYEWSLAHWGVKWNVNPANCHVHMTDTELEITFETAWSPPEAFAKVFLKRFPDVDTDLFYKESGCRIAGWID